MTLDSCTSHRMPLHGFMLHRKLLYASPLSQLLLGYSTCSGLAPQKHQKMHIVVELNLFILVSFCSAYLSILFIYGCAR